METRNQTVEFILLGLSDHEQKSAGMFLLFLIIYIITLMGNFIIMVVIQCDPKLHTPMYFFISNLSLVDICFTTVTVPRLLASFLLGARSISFAACFAQMYFFVALGITESFILAVMAYDRWMAICKPLNYIEVMNPRLCSWLIAGSFLTAFLHSLLHVITISRLSYCGHSHIHHFFCDMTALLKLSCSDTTTNELLIFTEGSVVIMSPFVFILVSYVIIVSSLLRHYSGEGRWRMFSTCSSHLTVVSLFYGTIIFIYFRPTLNYSLQYDRIVSVVYAVITPMLNPFIYSLRNADVRGALKKVTHRIIFSKNT
ncbi:olfactory receptor 1f45-like [Ambystoma mexicanum]|uniref:olfactory receptor 1f45-like n=1 Tax=Ambystoma mexicanum TaxID=8296 RepID=UPI0037E9442F